MIDDHCTNEWAAKVGQAWGDDEDSGQAKLANSAGHTIVKITPEQLGKWKKAVEPVVAQWSQSAAKTGVKPQDVLNEFRAELTKRNAAY